MRQLLQRARIMAMIGASPRPERHSNEVCRYLHDQGYEVIPVRPDRAESQASSSYAQLGRRPRPHRHRRHLPQCRGGAGTHPRGRAEGARGGLAATGCVEPRGRGRGGEPRRHPRGRRLHRGGAPPRQPRARTPAQARRAPQAAQGRVHGQSQTSRGGGYVAGGGGGHAGGGGVRAALDEKKMVAGRPSPRKGLVKALAALTLRGRHRGGIGH